MNADMLCPWCKSPPCSDATGAICSTTTDWECGSSIGCAHQWQSSACKRIERLQAIVDRIQKDADGNPILPGDAGFALRFPALGGKPHIIQMRVDAVEIACIRSWKDGTARPENFYRSREAAEKARTT